MKTNKWIPLYLFLFVFIALGGTYLGHSALVSSAPQFEGPYIVLRAVDGDTIEIDRKGQKAKIRLLCVDAPESVHPNRLLNTEAGKRASEFTKHALEGRWIMLEFEGKEKEDRYGRLLAYVHINFNIELVRQGHAKYYTKYGKSLRYDEILQKETTR